MAARRGEIVRSAYLESCTLIRMPSALAYFSSVDKRISSAWFSMREIADFFVRSFLAMASWVTPARSRASRSMTLNSNASYHDSKSFSNFGLRAFRFSMYRSTSLMTFPFFPDIRFAFSALVRFLSEAFSAASSQIHLSESRALVHRRIQAFGNPYHPSEPGFPRFGLRRQASSDTAQELYQFSRRAGAPKLPSGHAGRSGHRGIAQQDKTLTMSDRIQWFAQSMLTYM